MIMSKNEEQKCFQTLTEGRDHIIRRTVTSAATRRPRPPTVDSRCFVFFGPILNNCNQYFSIATLYRIARTDLPNARDVYAYTIEMYGERKRKHLRSRALHLSASALTAIPSFLPADWKHQRSSSLPSAARIIRLQQNADVSLPRDAKLAWRGPNPNPNPSLSPSVCRPIRSVCHKSEFYRKGYDGLNWVLAKKLTSIYLTGYTAL